MIATEKLENIITKCHIIKSFYPLPESTLGYYYDDGDYHCILINESIKHDERLCFVPHAQGFMLAARMNLEGYVNVPFTLDIVTISSSMGCRNTSNIFLF
ncbi:hypothetical protein HNQ80_002664 [Anaerosolibacter carboniphilus]|uniref:Uncharacterized protein n=1 Tax=Anaerosolibacter carboniphilus TaxID=1417629 RepID=A0A841L075_9FIRM|nr:hypothetical protein [Anaerosolibacter carboniphilus]